ncbi:MAG: sugar ABC transporter permease [Chloroflexota bacterium]|nr:sugar ABC transporter permease [Chloroflexota bacterium]
MSQTTSELAIHRTGATQPFARGARLSGWIDRHLHILFPLPALIVVVAIMLYPLSYTLVLSTRNYGTNLRKYNFVGIRHFVDLMQDERFIDAFGRTFYFTLLTVTISIALGMLMALIMNRDFFGAPVVRTLFLLPMVATPVATSLVWMMMFNPTLGVLNYFLQMVGLPPSLWVADTRWVIPSIVMVDVWHSAPFAMLILLAGLRSLPVEPFESAMIDGASRWQMFTKITLPLIRPALVVALMFRTIDALKVFDLIWVMTAGGPGYDSETMYVYAYNNAFKYLNLGYGSAVILVFTLIVALASVFWVRLRNREWI